MALAFATLQAPVNTVVRPYTSGTITPSANARVYVIVSNTGSAGDTGSQLASAMSSTFSGLTWNIEQSFANAATATATYVWWAQFGASPGSGTLTLTSGASPADSNIAIIQVTGHDPAAAHTGSVGAVSVAINPSLTLAAAPDAADATLAFSTSRNDANGAIAGAGMTLYTNIFKANPTASQAMSYRTGSTSTTVPFDGLNTVNNTILAFNVKAAAAPPAGRVWRVRSGGAWVTKTLKKRSGGAWV